MKLQIPAKASPAHPSRPPRSVPGGRLILAAGFVASACLGCNQHKDLVVFLRAHEHLVSSGRYRVAPPDVISISAPIAPEINDTEEQIRADGKISLRLLGEVKVVGLTPQEIAAKLETLLSRYYNDPKVNVQVTQYVSQKYYVFGQVTTGGPQPYTGRDTVLDALAKAQPTYLAWNSQIKVIRPSADSTFAHEITIDLDKMTQSGDLRLNVLLQEGDVVWVPPTPMGSVGLAVQQVFFPFFQAAPAVSTYASTVQAISTVQTQQNYNAQQKDRRKLHIFSQ
jgi:polysaccharide export outer membrane protein